LLIRLLVPLPSGQRGNAGASMSEFWIGGQRLELPATPRAQERTRDAGAWLDKRWISVELTAAITALRVHTDGREFPTRPASNAAGAWLLIGDIVQTSSEIVNGRSLPGVFTHIARAEVFAGSILNIGFCSPLFGGRGGEAQAEFVRGPDIKFTPMDSTWVNYGGTA
jgi:hypothetical protein